MKGKSSGFIYTHCEMQPIAAKEPNNRISLAHGSEMTPIIIRNMTRMQHVVWVTQMPMLLEQGFPPFALLTLFFTPLLVAAVLCCSTIQIPT